MAKKTLDLTGTKGKEYDLDEISKDSRVNSSRELVIQVVEYDPFLDESPNPEKPAIGQIWLSKKVNKR